VVRVLSVRLIMPLLDVHRLTGPALMAPPTAQCMEDTCIQIGDSIAQHADGSKGLVSGDQLSCISSTFVASYASTLISLFYIWAALTWAHGARSSAILLRCLSRSRIPNHMLQSYVVFPVLMEVPSLCIMYALQTNKSSLCIMYALQTNKSSLCIIDTRM
jgi:hypothetical protein